MKPVILFDSDDVAVDFTGVWLQELNKQYNTNVQAEQIKSWNMAKYFPELTQEQVYGVLDNADIWQALSPMPGSRLYLSLLYEEGYRLYMATATPCTKSDHKCRRIQQLFPFLDHEHIIISHNKQMIRGDVLIDDGPHNLVGGEYYKILFERPHNVKFPNEEYDMHRVRGWDEVYQLIHDNFPIQ